MCGINLIIDKKSRLNEKPILLMNKATSHRGPDFSDYYKFSFTHSTVFLGANRLAITPPTKEGNQPLISEDKQFGLSFNGEIYNTKDLQKNIEKDHSSESDSETLLLGLIEKGPFFLEELNGMFALAFIDSSNDEVTFARDPKGIKSLYYYEDENYFIASSEIKGIISSQLIKKELNESQIYHYLLFKYPQPPYTFYKNIFELDPGSYLKVSKNETVKKDIKYQTEESLSISNTDILKSTERLLLQAVEKQMPKSVTSGLFFSGGIDSTLLLALINELGYKNYPVFSIINKVEDSSFGTEDYRYINKAKSKFSLEQTIIETDSSLLKSFPDFVSILDQPVADNAFWLTWLLSKSAVKSVKTVFSGAGADEYFAGYNRHKAFQYYLNLAPLGTPLMKKLAAFPEAREIPFRKNFRMANKFLSSIDETPEKTWENFTSFTIFKNGFLNKIQKYPGKRFQDNKDLLKQAFQDDQNRYLISDVLKVTDNASMAAGLEVRVPYLDLELTQFISRLSSDQIMKSGPKWVLKNLLKNRGGKDFINRPKEGFGMPFGKWVKSMHGSDLLKIFWENKLLFEYLRKESIDKLVKLHMGGKRDFSGELFSLILLGAWLEKEFS